MRISEVLNLQWKDVDILSATITLQPDDVKEGSVRTIGIESELFEYLTEIRTQNRRKGVKSKKHVFGVTKDSPYTYRCFYNTWKRYTKGTAYDNLLPHDLRHSYVTRKRREGHDRELIKVQTGHKTNIMYERYNSIHKDEVIELSGVNKEKVSLIEEDIKMLMTKCHEQKISLSTVHSVIRSNIVN
jgi:integrase